MRVGIDRADLVQDLEHVGGREGRLAGGQLVEDHAQREDVAGERGRLAADLLRGQIARRAEEALARLGEAELGRLVGAERAEPAEPAGQAEVEDLHDLLVADHHVLGLEVAVHDAGLVGGRHARGDLAGDREQLVERQRSGRASGSSSGWPGMYSMAMIGTPAVSSTA